MDSIHEEGITLLPNKTANKITGTWNDIKRIATNESQVSQAFFQHAKLQLGDGLRIRFWEDLWFGNTTLQHAYPRLYKISSQQKEVIHNMGWFEGDVWRWVLAWKRVLNMEESREEESMHSILQQHSPTTAGRDQLAWDLGNNFTVRSLYSKVANQMESGGSVDRIVCSVWQNLVPPKVELMVWLALLGKLNTKDNLLRKGIIPIDLHQCTFCQNHVEDIDNLLVSCSVTCSV